VVNSASKRRIRPSTAGELPLEGVRTEVTPSPPDRTLPVGSRARGGGTDGAAVIRADGLDEGKGGWSVNAHIRPRPTYGLMGQARVRNTQHRNIIWRRPRTALQRCPVRDLESVSGGGHRAGPSGAPPGRPLGINHSGEGPQVSSSRSLELKGFLNTISKSNPPSPASTALSSPAIRRPENI
jgi:hypothetical protein